MKTALFYLLLLQTVALTGMAQRATVMTDREAQMIEEINLVRTQPLEYISIVKENINDKHFNGSEKRVAKELIKMLKTMEPLLPLSFSPSLYKTAKQHGEWMLKKKKFKHSQYVKDYRENLIGGVYDVRQAVLDLLVDYKVAGRGHRNTILFGRLKHIAVYELKDKKVAGLTPIFIQQFQ